MVAERALNMPQRVDSLGDIVPNVQQHSGQRTAITWWAEAGYDEHLLMSWAGHLDAGLTLRIYGKLGVRRKHH
jgi:hypothetical protein